MDWENTGRIVEAIDRLTQEQYVANLIAWNAYFSTPKLQDKINMALGLGI